MTAAAPRFTGDRCGTTPDLEKIGEKTLCFKCQEQKFTWQQIQCELDLHWRRLEQLHGAITHARPAEHLAHGTLTDWHYWSGRSAYWLAQAAEHLAGMLIEAKR